MKISNNTIQIKNAKYWSFFDDMIADILSNKKHNPIVTKLFIIGGNLNISLAFTTQSYFAVPKNIRLNYTHYFIMNVPNKQELQQIVFNHWSDIDYRTFIDIDYRFRIFTKNVQQNHILF